MRLAAKHTADPFNRSRILEHSPKLGRQAVRRVIPRKSARTAPAVSSNLDAILF